MADISAIKALDGVTYSIKDSEARDHLVPASGTTGQVLTKTASGYEWDDATGGGNVDTVNGISPDANKNVQTIVELTQSQYDAIQSPDPNVVYYITDSSTSYPDASSIRYEIGVSVADALDDLRTSTTIQFLGNGWSTTETINGVVYYTQTISVTSVFDIHPEISIVPNSGILPTEIEQSAYDLVDYFTVDKNNNIVKGYASTAPSDTFSVIVKGVS